MSVDMIPQYLSAPYQVMWWEADEVAVFMVGYVCANAFGKFFELSIWALATWVGIISLPMVYKYFKNRYPSGFLKHALYFAGIKEIPHYPSFFIKHYCE